MNKLQKRAVSRWRKSRAPAAASGAAQYEVFHHGQGTYATADGALFYSPTVFEGARAATEATLTTLRAIGFEARELVRVHHAGAMHADMKAKWQEILPFVPADQHRVVAQAIAKPGESADEFREIVYRMHRTITGMPKTYEQEAKGEDAIVHLHYFGGSSDWYITERDADPDGDGQVQASGLADLYGDGGESGYINIKELCELPGRYMFNLDFHFTPRTLREVLAEREHRRQPA